MNPSPPLAVSAWLSRVCPAGGCVLSVAVVTNSSLDIRSLQGLRSCHSGVRWTAGWSLPLGFLLSRNYLSWSKEQPLSHGSQMTISRRAFKSLWPSKVSSPLTCFCPLEQMSVPFSVPAASLELRLWRRHSAPCAEARSLTSATRTTTAKRPTASPSTAAKGPSGQPKQRDRSTDNVQLHFKREQTLNSRVVDFVFLWQMSQERSRRCCICRPPSSW